MGSITLDNESARAKTWIGIYVMLSRCRRLENILLVCPPPNLRQILEAGPPAFVHAEMDRLAALARDTRPRIDAARLRLGWPAVRR
jgi:hypothetical protein